MVKRFNLSLLFLGGLAMGMVSCGGSGSTESSDITPGEVLTFIMGNGHGTINIKSVTPTSGIVYYLNIPVVQGTTSTIGSYTSDSSVNFFYRPSTHEFGIDFRTGNNFHIDPGPVTVDYQMNCSFRAIVTKTFETGNKESGTMEYSLDRWPSNDPHAADALLRVSVTGQPGTYSFGSTGEE